MFYSIVDSEGFMVKSQFTTDPHYPTVPEGHRLVQDDSTRPSGFDRLTQKLVRVEPVTGDSVEYRVETREAFIEMFSVDICPVPVNKEDYAKIKAFDISFPGLIVFKIDLSTPITWKFRPFNRSNYHHRQVVVGGNVVLHPTNNARPDEVMTPGNVWPLDDEYKNIDQFTMTASSPNTELYCIFAQPKYRVIEDSQGIVNVGGVKFRVEYVVA